MAKGNAFSFPGVLFATHCERRNDPSDTSLGFFDSQSGPSRSLGRAALPLYAMAWAYCWQISSVGPKARTLP